MTGGIVAMLALGAAVPGGGPVAAIKPVVRVDAPELMVRDVVEIRGGALPAATGALVVARLPRGAERLDIPAADMAALLRRRVPGLRLLPARAAVVRVFGSLPRASAAPEQGCYATATAMAAEAALSAEDVTRTSCRAGRPARVVYDRAGGAHAGAALPRGAYLGRLAPLPSRAIGKGAPLTLRSTAGVVTIEREVVALQPGRSGRRVFVRDAQGQVFAAPLALEGASR